MRAIRDFSSLLGGKGEEGLGKRRGKKKKINMPFT